MAKHRHTAYPILSLILGTAGGHLPGLEVGEEQGAWKIELKVVQRKSEQQHPPWGSEGEEELLDKFAGPHSWNKKPGKETAKVSRNPSTLLAVLTLIISQDASKIEFFIAEPSNLLRPSPPTIQVKSPSNDSSFLFYQLLLPNTTTLNPPPGPPCSVCKTSPKVHSSPHPCAPWFLLLQLCLSHRQQASWAPRSLSAP